MLKIVVLINLQYIKRQVETAFKDLKGFFPVMEGYNMKTSTTAFLTSILVAMTHFEIMAATNDGGMVGGGGDPLRSLFFDARNEAAQIVAGYRAASLIGRVKPKVAAWIEQNHRALEWDIKESTHDFDAGTSQTTCAHTVYQAAADIQFHLPACRAIKTPKQAVSILIHESTHHLGIRSEETAEEIATALTLGSSHGTLPSNQDPSNVPTVIPSTRLTCTQKLLEGEDQHPLMITYVFTDPTSGQGLITYDARRIDIVSGHETVTQKTFLPISSMGYPRVDRSPNGGIQILASHNGTFDRSAIPAQYSMAKFAIDDRNAQNPTLKVELFYARAAGGDSYVPSGTFKCSQD